MGCCNSIPKELLKSDEPFYKVITDVKVWERDSHGLFDYDHRHSSQTEIDITGNVFLHGNGANVLALLPSVVPEDIFMRKLLSIAYKEGRYWIYHSKDFTSKEAIRAPSEQPWISLKHLNSVSFGSRFHPKYGYKLKKGDIIKFGRVRFKVTKISLPPNKYGGSAKG